MSLQGQWETFGKNLAREVLPDRKIHKGRRFKLQRLPSGNTVDVVLGYRVGQLRMNAGLDNARLVKELTPEVLWQHITWDCPGNPTAYVDRREVVVEAALPPEMQDVNVPLNRVANFEPGCAPLDGSKLFLGFTRKDTIITLPTDHFAHYLVAGMTGSGKSWVLRLLAYLLSLGNLRNGPKTQIVLLDGKGGEGLSILNGLPGQVGPLAITEGEWIDALGWLSLVIDERYAQVRHGAGKKLTYGTPELPHIIVIADEPQMFLQDGRCTEITDLVTKVLTQGRAAGVRMVAGTHKVSLKMFGATGNSNRDQFGVTLGGQVKTDTASRLLFDDDRCTRLLGHGDFCVNAPDGGGAIIDERIQMAHVQEDVLERHARHAPLLDSFPEFDVSQMVGHKGRGRPQINFTEQQLSIAIRGAAHVTKDGKPAPRGRTWLENELEANECPIAGTGPLRRLLAQGRAIHADLEEHHYCKQGYNA